nr:tyrosine-type recombinase/integrase [Microbacterium lacticum]
MTPRPATPPGEHGRVFLHRDDRAGRDGWRAQTRYRPTNGDPARLVEAHGRTQALAQRALLAKIAQHNAGVTPETATISPSTTVSDLVTRWLARERAAGILSPQTLDRYTQVTRTHITEGARRTRKGTVVPLEGAPRVLGGDAVGGVDAVRVERVLDFLGTAAPGQVKAVATVLRQSFEWALREGAISENPVRTRVRRVRHSKASRSKRKRLATFEELDAFRAAAVERESRPRTGRYLVDLFDVLRSSGLRVSEALAIHAGDVTFNGDHAQVALDATMVEIAGIGIVRQERPKSEQSRRQAPVVGVGAEALHRLVAAAKSAQRDYLFVSRAGTPLGQRQVEKVWRDVATAANLDEGFTPHAIRRATGTAVARKHGVEQAAIFLGNTKDVAAAHYVDQGLIEVGDVSGALLSLQDWEREPEDWERVPLSPEEFEALFGELPEHETVGQDEA